MPVVRNAGLRSDGELVQAVSEKVADAFEFKTLSRDASTADAGHKGWSDIADFNPPIYPSASASDDDELPDTIIWEIAGNGTSTSDGRLIEVAYDISDRTWSVDGEEVDTGGLSALLLLF